MEGDAAKEESKPSSSGSVGRKQPLGEKGEEPMKEKLPVLNLGFIEKGNFSENDEKFYRDVKDGVRALREVVEIETIRTCRLKSENVIIDRFLGGSRFILPGMAVFSAKEVLENDGEFRCHVCGKRLSRMNLLLFKERKVTCFSCFKSLLKEPAYQRVFFLAYLLSHGIFGLEGEIKAKFLKERYTVSFTEHDVSIFDSKENGIVLGRSVFLYNPREYDLRAVREALSWLDRIQEEYGMEIKKCRVEFKERPEEELRFIEFGKDRFFITNAYAVAMRKDTLQTFGRLPESFLRRGFSHRNGWTDFFIPKEIASFVLRNYERFPEMRFFYHNERKTDIFLETYGEEDLISLSSHRLEKLILRKKDLEEICRGDSDGTQESTKNRRKEKSFRSEPEDREMLRTCRGNPSDVRDPRKLL